MRITLTANKNERERSGEKTYKDEVKIRRHKAGRTDDDDEEDLLNMKFEPKWRRLEKWRRRTCVNDSRAERETLEYTFFCDHLISLFKLRAEEFTFSVYDKIQRYEIWSLSHCSSAATSALFGVDFWKWCKMMSMMSGKVEWESCMLSSVGRLMRENLIEFSSNFRLQRRRDLESLVVNVRPKNIHQLWISSCNITS